MTTTSPSNDGALLTYKDAARELATSVITVRRLAREGRLRSVRMSATLVRFTREDIQNFIEASKA